MRLKRALAVEAKGIDSNSFTPHGLVTRISPPALQRSEATNLVLDRHLCVTLFIANNRPGIAKQSRRLDNMTAMVTPLELGSIEFVFLWWPGDKHGVFVTQVYFDFLERFYKAKDTAGTWGDFLNLLGMHGREFVLEFCQYDDPAPKMHESMYELINDQYKVWVLADPEFPFAQCAQESYHLYKHVFLEVEGFYRIWTEYGEPIGLYPKASFVEMKKHIERQGHQVNCRLCSFPDNLCNYAQPYPYR